MSDRGKVVYRRAIPADRDRVMAIHQDVYEGGDYLPALYDIYMQNPDIHCFLGEKDGKAVAFAVKLIINDGKAMLGGAGRTDVTVQRQGLSQGINKFSSDEVMKMYPNLRYGLGANNQKRVSEKIMAATDPLREVIEITTVLYFKTNCKCLKLLSECIPPELTQQLRPIQTDTFFQDDQLRTRLFPEGIVKAYVSWVPYEATASNLKIVAQNCQTYYSTDSKGQVYAVSFGHLCPTKIFDMRYDIEFYHWGGRPATADEKAKCCFSHIIAHANHIVNISNREGKIGVFPHMPLDVDAIKVRQMLKPYIGERVRSEYFKDDFAYVVKSKI